MGQRGGIDYLKYDWSPNEEPETAEMAKALRDSGRDVIFSLSNNSPFTNAPPLRSWPIAGGQRETFVIRGTRCPRKDSGRTSGVKFSGPGHWNDPDMLVVGQVGWGAPHPTKLTPDEQYTHISLWCLVSSPLLLGCPLDQMDDFTLSLLTNDEVLAVSQDSLGQQATAVSKEGDLIVYAKDLDDGSKAVGLFNMGDKESNGHGQVERSEGLG